MVRTPENLCSVASNNNLAIIAPSTFKRHNALTIAPPAICTEGEKAEIAICIVELVTLAGIIRLDNFLMSIIAYRSFHKSWFL